MNAFLSSILAPNKIGSIISVDHPDIPSSANESSQCQYQAISTHAVCNFVCLRPSLTINGLNMSIPQNVKRGSWVSPSDGRSPIFCRQTFPLNCLEATHLDIIDFTALVQLMIQ